MSRFKGGLFCWFFCAHIFVGCGKESDRKIKLASEESNRVTNIQAAASVLDVTPENQHSIIILPFQNQTADTSLDWLSRGLADMLASDLSQSQSIHVVEMTRLYAGLNELEIKGNHLDDLSAALEAAQKAKVKTIITGEFYREEQGIEIFATLRDVENAQIIRKERVLGPNLERIFRMVDELSEKLRSVLREGLEHEPETRHLSHVTQSVEAFRCYSKALENLDKFDHGEAEACLNKAIEIDSAFAKAYLLMARLKFRTRDIKAVERALTLAKRYTDRLSESDRIWLRFYSSELTGDISGTLAAMKELVQFEPDDPETRMQLAGLHFMLKDYDRARAEYELILEVEPKQKLAYNQLAYLHAFRGDFTTALEYLDRYTQIAPDEPNPHDSRGEVLLMAGRFREAAEEFKTALKIRPDFVSSMMKLCDIYSELDDLPRTLYYFEQRISAAQSDMEKASAYVKRAAQYWRFGKMAEAEKDLKRAEKMAPKYVLPVLFGREMYKAIGDTVSAHRLYESYLKRFVKSFTDKNLELYEMEGAFRFAMEADIPPQKLIPVIEKLRKNETRELHMLEYDMLLGILYLREGNFEKAREYCDQKREDFFGLLAQFPNQSRSKSWKYSIEAVRLEPKTEEPDLTFVDNLLKAAQKSKRKDLEVMARYFHAQYHGKQGHREDVAAVYGEVGTPREDDWRVIGPFENRSGFDRRFPPEASVDQDTVYKSRGRSLKWRAAKDGVYDGYVDLAKILAPSAWAVGYGVVHIHSPDIRKVQLRLATDESCKLWLNDKLVWQVFRHGDVPVDHDIVTVVLHPGDNKLLIKVTNSIGDWGFYLRVTDDDGDGFRDIRFRSAEDLGEPIAGTPNASNGE